MKTTRRGFITGTTAALAVLASTTSVLAEGASFSGKNITFWVPYKEGGGTDTWARFLASWMPKYLKGEPTFVIRNVTGGGAIGGGNEFARRAKSDGTDILATAGGLQLPFLLGDGRVQYKYDAWYPAFASPFGGVVYTRAEDAPKDPKDILNSELGFASIGASGSDLVPLIAFSLMEMNTKVTFGMKGRGPARLAILRGEVDVDYQTSSSYLKNVQPLVDEGKMKPLFSWGVIDGNGNVQRDPTFPDLPSFPEYYEMVHGKALEGPGWEAWKSVYSAGFAYQKFVVMPKDVPADVREAYRAAMDAMAQDPAFQEAAKAKLGAYQQIHGAVLDAAMERATSMSDDSRNWVTTWLKDTYDFEL